MFICLVADTPAEPEPGALETLARACSPRVEPHGASAVLFDARGLSRVCGPPDVLATDVVQLAASRGLQVRLGLASTRTAAWLLAHARSGCTVAHPETERALLAALPVGWLAALMDLDDTPSAGDRAVSPGGQAGAYGQTETARVGHMPTPQRGRAYRATPARMDVAPRSSVVLPRVDRSAAAERCQRIDAWRQRLATFERWGVRTLGDVAALPRADLLARMGPLGARCHQAACGEDRAPLVPVEEARRFEDRLELEWPIEGLEPLSFVLSRQCDRLSAQLERADRGAMGITTRLHLVTRDVHERTLTLPAPLREARVLRTLILLDLESHPPPAAIDVVEIGLDVTPGAILQGGLFAQTQPTSEDLTTLLARLRALMGETRIGAPALQDSHDARATGMQSFRLPRATPAMAPRTGAPVVPEGARPRAALRRFRVPLAARVITEHGLPRRVVPAASSVPAGAVVTSAGPWRTAGAWWEPGGGWNRDEWDVELASGGVYRLVRHGGTGRWEIEGLFD